jgi:hypothetical protein
LIAEACRACGIAAKHLFNAAVDADGVVVLVTNGGAKVRWVEGLPAEKLSEKAITGIPDQKKRRKVAGK